MHLTVQYTDRLDILTVLGKDVRCTAFLISDEEPRNKTKRPAQASQGAGREQEKGGFRLGKNGTFCFCRRWQQRYPIGPGCSSSFGCRFRLVKARRAIARRARRPIVTMIPEKRTVGSSTTVLKNAHVWEVISPLPVSYHSKSGDSMSINCFVGTHLTWFVSRQGRALPSSWDHGSQTSNKCGSAQDPIPLLRNALLQFHKHGGRHIRNLLCADLRVSKAA